MPGSRLAFSADCTSGGSGEIDGTFDASYDNTGNASSVTGTLTSVELTLAGSAKTMKWTFQPAPVDSGSVAAGATSQVTYAPQASTGSGSDNPCGFCNGDVTLKVTWTLDDTAKTQLTDTLASGKLACKVN